jgi:hypothetical protein
MWLMLEEEGAEVPEAVPGDVGADVVPDDE